MPSNTADLINENVGATTADDAKKGETDVDDTSSSRRRSAWAKVVVFGVMPLILFAMTLAAAYFKWHGTTAHEADCARSESVQAAKDSMVALLSYQAPTADKQLRAAVERTTGKFTNEYQDLINRVVIPGAQQKLVSATAEVIAAAPVSTTPNHAVVLVFVNQSTGMGTEKPTDMQSSVRVTMDKVDGRWLVSGFEPV
jgi:Mce-associated membrane protein